jgi:hypothetical protein
MRYEVQAEGHFGWFMLGSQVLGYTSWGQMPTDRRYSRLDRIELAVGFFPYAEEEDEGEEEGLFASYLNKHHRNFMFFLSGLM